MNETCPPDPIGQSGQQTDLNDPANVPADSVTFIQRHSLDDVADLCGAGMSPGLSTAVIMQIVANHFADPALIMSERLKQYIWTTDPGTNKIRIAPNTRFDSAQGGLLPAIVVKRGPMTSQRRVMGDRIDSIIGTDQDDGILTYARFITGTHQLYCIAEADGEAEDLALEVFDTLTFLAPVLERELPFHEFQATSLGELGVIESLGNQIAVPIGLQYTYEYAWAVQPHGRRLKTLDLKTP